MIDRSQWVVNPPLPRNSPSRYETPLWLRVLRAVALVCFAALLAYGWYLLETAPLAGIDGPSIGERL